ncbi:hypothetical protein HZI73_18290 [Vallitalea pronyensis]|uniref:Intracellular proteinase inhibitor BsuPI domain-containing protein n=1 Tax=Vallitalea pronyensis TaxID=1348613 RepID=A0A8J8MM88_9FIRM|nr:BsuPI-related putative proteinase inhibitor [Vallitalea pronyensis]QUI24121.1 hypothetical protein HZI73_18290 [Vallitalea pronyensis]
MMKKLYTVIVLIAVLTIGGIGYNMLQAKDEQKPEQKGDTNEVVQALLDGILEYRLTKNDDGEITIALKNVSEQPFTLNYTSSQMYDFQLLQDGKVTYLWSALVSFAAVISDKTLEPGEQEVYEIDTKILPVPVGEYEFQFYSVAQELQHEPKVTTKIDIKVSNQSPLDHSTE